MRWYPEFLVAETTLRVSLKKPQIKLTKIQHILNEEAVFEYARQFEGADINCLS